MEETGAAAAVALDGGPSPVGLESTVVSLLDGELRLLRPGRARGREIEARRRAAGARPRSTPRARRAGSRALRAEAPLRLDAMAPLPGEAYLAFGPAPPGAGVWNLSPSGDLREAAANLFAHLRAADRSGMAAIAVAPIPEDGLGEAINDRLRRAAGFVG